MAQYIDKYALVAEIEKRFDEYSSSILKHYDACTEARASELGKILVILNTLEVKEVNLEEILKEYFKGWEVNGDLGLVKPDGWSCIVKDLYIVAKHFFKLGLMAQKGE